MTKQHQPLYLTPEAADGVVALATALGITNQRGQASISAFCEWIGGKAQHDWHTALGALSALRQDDDD